MTARCPHCNAGRIAVDPGSSLRYACPDCGGTGRQSLPNDIARCDGIGSDAEGWREGCDTCLRRTAKRSGFGPMIAPPAVITFACEYLIEP